MDIMEQIRAERREENAKLKPIVESTILEVLADFAALNRPMPTTATLIADCLIDHRIGREYLRTKKEMVALTSGALKRLQKKGKVQKLQGIGLTGKIAYVWEVKPVTKTAYSGMYNAIFLLRKNEPKDGYYGGFSGGKDSCVIKHLAKRAGVQVEWHYHMSIDPPELVLFVREKHPDVIVDRPEMQIFKEVEKRGMPWVKARWCCSIIKERHGKGYTKILGVRKEESPRRMRTWDEVTGDVVAPICLWSTDDVWEYIRMSNVPYCALYDEGFERLGCVGCPLAGKRKRDKEFKRWPKFEAAWRAACKRLWDAPGDWAHKKRHDTEQEYWEWWRYEARSTDQKKVIPCGDVPMENVQS